MQDFSVLMSIYCRENPNWLRTSMESVFSQTVQPTEVVLVEDGPLTPELDKEVAELTDKYPQLRVISFAENRGLGRALHEGLKECRYDLVARMDTDDICEPTRFEKQLRVFEQQPEVDVCGAWISEFETTPDQIVSVRRLPESHEELYEFGKKRNPMSHPVCMFRRQSVQMNGNYQDYPLFEDYFLWVRLLVYGCRFYCIQESLLRFRRSQDMIRRRGGFRYALTELRFLCMMYGVRYITFPQMFKNCIIRFSTRMMPNSIRRVIYNHIRKTI